MNASTRGTITCSRSKRCAYCSRTHSKLCDYPTGKHQTCDTPMCAGHTWSPELGKDYCRTHHTKMLEPKIKEKIALEREANRRPGLRLIAQSRYDGYCKDKDCGQPWNAGDPMYWDPETKEVFCTDCGEQML